MPGSRYRKTTILVALAVSGTFVIVFTAVLIASPLSSPANSHPVGTSASPSPAVSPTGLPPHIFAAGDSLTVGYFATDATHDYLTMVSTSIHLPVMGTSAIYGTNVPATYASIVATPPAPSDIIIVELGTNDGNDPLPQFKTQYGQIVSVL